MSSAWLGIAALAVATAARAQGLAATEWSAGALVLAAHRPFVGAGIGWAHRSDQGRFGLAVAGGREDGEAAVRVEGTGQFIVNADARTGVTVYAALGLAWQGARDLPGTAYLLAFAGLEAAGGRASGWFLEGGLGGGARVAVGWRWRRFPEWWR